MEKERPRLSLAELNQTRWLLGALLTLVALSSVLFLDVNAWALLGLATLAVVVALIRPSLLARVPNLVHKLAFPVVLGVFAFDYYTFRELLPALVRLGILLLLYRSIGYRKRRDDLQLILLGLFLIVVAGVLTVSIGFALQIVVFTALALGLLFARTLVDAAEAGKKPAVATPDESIEAPAWTAVHWPDLLRRLVQVSDWRVWCFSVLLFAGLVFLAGVLFLSIPRYQLENSLFLDRWMSRKSVTGFSDTLRFGEVSDIQKDESVAMHVEVSDPAKLPTELYWRMTVLDEYRDHTFGVSPALKARFSREVTQSTVNRFGILTAPNALQWTFYVEPGVSRYLPLLGGFRHLTFTEPQVFRVSDRLRVMALSRDPSTMKAYRIIGMDTSGVLRESMQDPARAHVAEFLSLFRTLPFGPEEIARWESCAREITGGKTMPVADFAKGAIAWLHARHRYALQSTVPAGKEDPLLRWCVSQEPGHCELFAGSFAMLARAAGHPCRVVAGFLGGTWNGDYLLVRNSNAHAWCEIYDGKGNWLRIDPTVAPSETGGKRDAADLAGRLTTESGFSAQLDRLRMLWYRHIVNFDRADQQSLVRSFKEKTEQSSQQFREQFQKLVRAVVDWFRQPWDFSRAGPIAFGALTLAVGVWWWRRFGRTFWISSRKPGRTALHPVRREAGRWLEKFESARKVSARSKNLDTRPEVAAAISDLQRLRYARAETWPEPRGVFKRARHALKTARSVHG
ncbi:MAG TPA: transglutaminaseTgpA domain-containing protein [Opitutaceae bacterium]|nr:transglutaminaseTgpA domain-containing protein [Opitutaceae bacterium]